MILKFTKECIWHIKKGRPEHPIFACAEGAIVDNLPVNAQQAIIDAGYAIEADPADVLTEDYYKGYV